MIRTLLGRLGHGAAVLAFLAAVAAVIAASARAPLPKDHDKGLCCTAPGCTHRPGWEEIARAMERDRVLDRLGAIDPDGLLGD